MVDDAGLARMFVPKASALEGLRDGTLRRIGSNIYHVSGGIHSHMQETAAFDPKAITSQLAGMTGTLNAVSNGVQIIKVLQLANVALTAIDIGVSVVGFAVMNAKLNALRDDIQVMSEKLETLRAERIEEDFVLLATYVERFEEAWFLRDGTRAGSEWLTIGGEARRLQDLFAHRAAVLLKGELPGLALADRMLDALSTVSELRVSATMAAGEDRLAERIADASAGEVAALTAAMGPVDIARRQLPADAAPGRPDWPSLIGSSMGRAKILSRKWREREARMGTRSSIIPALRSRGVSTHDWLRTARAETDEPLLIVPAG